MALHFMAKKLPLLDQTRGYLKDYASVTEARAGIEQYVRFYNQARLHQSLNYQTPAAVYLARR